jgi:long-subunit acyl-CoA synthetase (AMP-forming)
MTETAVVVASPSEHDIVKKTAGSLLPTFTAKLMSPDGVEITEHDEPGELLVQSPSVVLGYLNNEKATSETFVHHDDGRWIRTGDEAIVTISPSGNEHLVIVDRIKELIKVKVSRESDLIGLWMQTRMLTKKITGLSGCTCRARSTSSHT